MRRIIFLSILFLILLVTFSSQAMAEKYYFYKEVGKKLPRGQRYDSSVIEVATRRFPNVILNLDLPKKYSNSGNRVKLALVCALSPNVAVEEKYKVSIESFALRDSSKTYPLSPGYSTTNILPEDPLYRKLTAYEMIDGKIRTKYEIEVTADDSLMPSFVFEAPESLPSHLFLDYKFRIRKEGGPEEIFKGTISMELASYNVGWWEKMME